MRATGESRFGLVVAATLAIAACGRTSSNSTRAKDSGLLPDLDIPMDALADARSEIADARPDTLDADGTIPETVGKDGSPDVEDGGPDSSIVRNEDAAADAGVEMVDAGLDASLDRPDAAGLDATGEETGPDTSIVRGEVGAEGIALDAAAKGSGPLECHGSVAFGTPPLVETGSHPNAVAAGDLDRDGKLDVVTANFGSNSVSVLLGRGDGTFAPRLDYPVGAGPVSLALGDMDGDGNLDLASANLTSATVSVVLGKGDGTFLPKGEYVARTGAHWVGLRDLNGDGKPDLVVANGDDHTVSVLLGKGDGSFASRVDLATDNASRAVALGDLNGDGKVDLLVVGESSSPYSTTMLFGAGDGTFPTMKGDGWGSEGLGVYSVELSDLNGDGKLDLVGATTGEGVRVRLGIGGAALGWNDNYPTGAHAASLPCCSSALALGDVNADGKTDLVVANESSDTVSILLGTGDGTFATNVDYPTGGTPVSVALGDLNGDGNLDVVVASHEIDAVTVLLGRGDGTFPGLAGQAVGKSMYSPRLGDMNGDGLLDLVGASSDRVSVLLGAGDGSFPTEVDTLAPAVRLPPYYVDWSALRLLALGDFNGDGKLDVLASRDGISDLAPGSWSKTIVLPGIGGGKLGAEVDTGLGDTNLAPVIIGDLDGDGRLDFVAPRSGSKALRILLGKGDGTFAAGIELPTGDISGWVLGDLNGDAELDLVAPNAASNAVRILRGKGDGTFADPLDVVTGAAPTDLALGDLNGDGKMDVVTANHAADTVSVLLGMGGGKVAVHADFPTRAPSHVALGDMNGDGKLDVAAGSDETGMVSVLLGTGDGRLAAGNGFAAGSSLAFVRDMNADSRADLIMASPGMVSVLLSSCR
jgi:hypothetical protein